MAEAEKPQFSDLEAGIKHFKKSIGQYLNLLTPDSLEKDVSKKLCKVQPSSIESIQLILVELKKIFTLIHAHFTKIGIVFKWPIPERNINAGKTQLKECLAIYTLLMSLLSQFFNQFKAKASILFHRYVAGNMAELFELTLLLASELELILLHSFETQYADNKRLVLIGKVWNKCEVISKDLRLNQVENKPGNVNLEFLELLLLKNELSSNLDILTDALADLEEWMQDPQCNDDFDEDDPFGLEDDLSEDEYEIVQIKKKMEHANLNKEMSDADSQVSKEQKIEFANRYIPKIKMVKLLYTMIIKTISKKNDTCFLGVTVDELNDIYRLQFDIVSFIDELVSLICLAKKFNKQDVVDTYKELEKSCIMLNSLGLKKLIDLEEKNAKKDILAESWQAKFLQ